MQRDGSWVLIDKVYGVSHLKSNVMRCIHQHPAAPSSSPRAGPEGGVDEGAGCRQPLLKSLSHTVYSNPSVAHLNEHISECLMIIQEFPRLQNPDH